MWAIRMANPPSERREQNSILEETPLLRDSDRVARDLWKSEKDVSGRWLRDGQDNTTVPVGRFSPETAALSAINPVDTV